MKKNNGLKYWIILLCCCGITASSVGIVVNTIGVFYTPVSEALGVSKGTFTMHATLCLIATAVVNLFIPKIMEKVSFKPMIIIGALLTSLSTFAMGFSHHVFLFYILGIIRGIGAALYGPVPVTILINNWFYKKNGFATSIALSCSGIAGALLSPVFTSMIESIGWSYTYMIVGILSMLLVLPFILIPIEEKPEKENKLPYLMEEGEKVEKPQTENEAVQFNAFQKKFILYFVVVLMLVAISGISSHLPSYATTIGLTTTTGSLMLSACMIGNVGSKLIIGTISDIIGITKSVILMIVINLVALVLFVLFKTSNVLLVASLLFGSIYSIAAVGLALMTREYFGNDNYSSAYSKIQFAINFGSAIAVTLIGYFYDFTASYALVFVIGIAIDVLSIFLLNIVRKLKTA